jgi:HEPN domain-containing protein/predicted nucleotidyltransferase
MKTSLSHLPEKKQEELALIKEVILENCYVFSVEMIILFGSYSTGKWVEDRYVKDGITYEYKSDFDILVVTRYERNADKNWRWKKIENIIKEKKKINKVRIIAHGISFFNEKIRDNYYFFVDIRKEGTLLYDSGHYQLATPHPLSPAKRKKKAQKYLTYWFRRANEFYDDFESNLKKKRYNKAAFELHQATECYYVTFLLVITDSRPKTHDIEELGALACKVNAEISPAFPRSTEEEERLFTLLQKAYIDSRYDMDYVITQEELESLAGRVKVLAALTKELCEAEIARYDSKTSK